MKITQTLVMLLIAAVATTSAIAQDGPMPPERERPPLPEELREQVREYRQTNRALRSELREELKALEDRNAETVREAVKAFREENAERYAAQRELGQEVRAGLREFRESLPDRPDRELPPELEALFAEFRDIRMDIREKKGEIRDIRTDESLTDEEKREAIAALRQEIRELHRDLKEKRRELRDQRGDGNDGPRRGDG